MGIVLILNFRPGTILFECIELLAISINNGLLSERGCTKKEL
ncbi:hypothetical protein V461_00195 [Pantoea ananatis BRT98]|nr:hypothetical protein V461_00195 [Pantoea ananatis BRT98]